MRCQYFSSVLGGLSAKVGLPAKFCVLAFKASLLYIWGNSSAKAGLSSRKSMFVCQVLCTQGFHQPKKVCLPDLSSQTFRCGHHRQKKVCMPNLLWYWGVHWQKKVHLPNVSSLAVLCFASQKIFSYYIQKT